MDRSQCRPASDQIRMGTTFRSTCSWGISVTAVELVPSIPKLFTYFHPDGLKALSSPKAHVVVDDGRRYLERSSQKYDVITIDPSSPVSAAGASLLYSVDFYSLVKRRLEPGGIVAQWLRNSDNAAKSSISRALRDSFPYVRVFGSVVHYGLHFLASNRPIPAQTAEELLARMPDPAIKDMMEWGPETIPEKQIDRMLSQEVDTGQLIVLSPGTPALSDDRPINEYFLLRELLTSFVPEPRERLRHILAPEKGLGSGRVVLELEVNGCAVTNTSQSSGKIP